MGAMYILVYIKFMDQLKDDLRFVEVRGTGAFYPEDEGKTDRVLCDRVIVVRKPDLETE